MPAKRMPMKIAYKKCPKCGDKMPMSAKTCPDCGHKFK